MNHIRQVTLWSILVLRKSHADTFGKVKGIMGRSELRHWGWVTVGCGYAGTGRSYVTCSITLPYHQ